MNFISTPLKEFADECMSILRDRYGANPTNKTFKKIYLSALYLEIRGELEETPLAYVSLMLKRWCKGQLPKLGLSEESTLENFRRGEVSEGITMQILKLNRLSLRDLMEDTFGEHWRDDE